MFTFVLSKTIVQLSSWIYLQTRWKKKRRVWKAKGFPFTFTVNAVQYILQLASMLAKLSDKERKKWSRYIAILSFHRSCKILEKFRWDLLFALSTRVNLFMSVQCYGLHGNWKGHNKSKPPFIRIKKRILWETLRNRQNHIKVSST